jgi:hypothetical protein
MGKVNKLFNIPTISPPIRLVGISNRLLKKTIAIFAGRRLETRVYRRQAAECRPYMCIARGTVGAPYQRPAFAIWGSGAYRRRAAGCRPDMCIIRSAVGAAFCRPSPSANDKNSACTPVQLCASVPRRRISKGRRRRGGIRNLGFRRISETGGRMPPLHVHHS